MMSEDERKYFLLINGETSGPFTADEVVARYEATSIPVETLYAYDGADEWQPVKGLLVSARANEGEKINRAGFYFLGVCGLAIGLLVLFVNGLDSSSSGEGRVKAYIFDQFVGAKKIRSIQSIGEGKYRAVIDGVNGFGGPVRNTIIVTINGDKMYHDRVELDPGEVLREMDARRIGR